MSDCMIHEEVINGKTIQILQDEDPPNPRDYNDNLGVIVSFHRGYDLGDKHDLRSEDFTGWADMEKFLYGKRKAVIILPLYLYDHSGLRIKVGSFEGLLPQGHAEFDSMMIGFIYVTAQKIRENWGVKRSTSKLRERAEAILNVEVSHYDDYLAGNAWGYSIKDENGDVEESCWGFIGDHTECLAEAKASLDTGGDA